jgi:hypothetical protein
MPKSPAWVKRYNQLISNAFICDASPLPWPGCEISDALAPEDANFHTLARMMAGMRQQLETTV